MKEEDLVVEIFDKGGAKELSRGFFKSPTISPIRNSIIAP